MEIQLCLLLKRYSFSISFFELLFYFSILQKNYHIGVECRGLLSPTRTEPFCLLISLLEIRAK